MNSEQTTICLKKIRKSCHEYGYATFCLVKGDSDIMKTKVQEVCKHAIPIQEERLKNRLFDDRLVRKIQKFENRLTPPIEILVELTKQSRNDYRKVISKKIYNLFV